MAVGGLEFGIDDEQLSTILCTCSKFEVQILRSTGYCRINGEDR